MNRRGFLGAMLRAGVAAMALPAATTYARIWVPKREVVVPVFPDIPYWIQTGRLALCYDENYVEYMNHMNEFWWEKPIQKEILERYDLTKIPRQPMCP